MNQTPPIPPPTGEIPKSSFSSSTSADYAVPGTAVSSLNLREVAAAQKTLLWSILAAMIVFVIPPLYLVAVGFQLWAIYRMGKTLNLPNVWLWVIATVIPLVGLLVLLFMSQKATTALQAAGIRVGLMGAKMKDFDK